VHSAGSPALVGNTFCSVALERKVADFLRMEEVVLYPTGWAAGFGVIKGLVRSADHVVMDMLSHSCLRMLPPTTFICSGTSIMNIAGTS
jgi:7-keto-8-aminopelargonate synthetase-like enzyme